MSGGRVRTRNDAAMGMLEPFLVCAPWQAERFDLEPFGYRVAAENLIDPTRVGSSGFLDRLGTLDALTFGPEGMPMPRWLFYEASALPGGIFGFGVPAERLTVEQRERLRLDGDAGGLVPLVMYIAIPVEPPGVWYGHNLASLNGVLPELGLKGLGTIAKAIGLKCFGCREQIGATQWSSKALYVHSKLGPLELMTAWTPAHADPATLTYRVRIDDGCLRRAMGEPGAVEPARPEAMLFIEAGDTGAMRDLQARIEGGERFVIPGAPVRGDEGRVVVPVGVVG